MSVRTAKLEEAAEARVLLLLCKYINGNVKFIPFILSHHDKFEQNKKNTVDKSNNNKVIDNKYNYIYSNLCNNLFTYVTEFVIINVITSFSLQDLK